MWKTLSKIIKKQLVEYEGKYREKLSTIFKNTLVGKTELFGLNQVVPFGVHGISFEHEYNLDNEGFVNANTSYRVRNPNLYPYVIPGSGLHNFFKMLDSRNGELREWVAPSRKGYFSIFAEVLYEWPNGNTGNYTLVIGDKEYVQHVSSGDLYATPIVFDEKDIPTISVKDISNKITQIIITNVGYYPEAEFKPINKLFVMTEPNYSKE